jgi:heme iron utilization protein
MALSTTMNTFGSEINDTDEHIKLLRELCSEQQLAVLATSNPDGPYTSLVVVAISQEDRKLYFATSRNTRKWLNLINNPKVSLLIDNRNNQVTDFSQAVAVTFQGETEELSEADRESGKQLYLARHPQMAEFIASPDTALFCVRITTIYLSARFQKINERIKAE